jgi:hypothetical protein
VPKQRCLTCNRLIDSRAFRGRCPRCSKQVKDERNRQAREFGPCPQDGLCGYCHGLYGPATTSDPFVWGHWPVRFIDGGKTAVPMHSSCNEGHAKRK